MYPFQLSGGMSQRVLIGMSVALRPDILIADEPTKGLDDRLKQDILDELMLIKKMGNLSLFLITHDLNTARELSERTAVMYAGEIIEMGDTRGFFETPRHPYSKALLESLPGRGFQPIPGSSPSPVDLPVGCRFHPRCPHRRDVCSERKPDLVRDKERDVRCVLFS